MKRMTHEMTKSTQRNKNVSLRVPALDQNYGSEEIYLLLKVKNWPPEYLSLSLIGQLNCSVKTTNESKNLKQSFFLHQRKQKIKTNNLDCFNQFHDYIYPIFMKKLNIFKNIWESFSFSHHVARVRYPLRIITQRLCTCIIQIVKVTPS